MSEKVTGDLLEALAGTPGPSGQPKVDKDDVFQSLTGSKAEGTFDVEQWLTDHGVQVVRKEPWSGGTKWILAVCPFNPDHTGNNKAIVGQLANGAIFAMCQHASCSEKNWQDMRDVYEPGWRDFKPLEAVNDPHRLARSFLESECSHPDGPTLRYHNGLWYFWDGSAYREEPSDSLETRLNVATKREFDHESVDAQRRGDARRSIARPVTKTIVSNVQLALRSHVIVPPTLSPPCWVGDEWPWEPSDVLLARNGLFHIPSLASGADDHLKPTPRFFSTFALEYEIDLNAPLPVEWLRFLEKLWPDDPECIATLQEWMGYILTPNTRQQKILGLIGPPRSGKGTIAKVMTRLVGERNVAGPTVSSLKSEFGLQDLLGKSLAIIADAELRRHDDTFVERLKAISGEDLVTINIKYINPFSVKLPTRLVLIGNGLPRFKDPSGALANRFILMRLTQSFLGKEDLGLAPRLLSELPGILLWAVEGWKRLRERGRLVQPASGLPLLKDLRDLGSAVGQFVRECCRVDSPLAKVPKEVLYNAYVEWWKSKGNDHPLASNTFGGELREVVPHLDVAHPVLNGKQVWCYVGIILVNPPYPIV
jgi:putative DNA primase/helicase